MAYTVKKLSELSGVTIRTLHYYEEEGILKPAYYGSNGYRYYEEKELLQLQQILFFKELGFTLRQIKKVLGKSNFDLLSALYSHKQALSREWNRIGRLIETVDETIKHLKGQKKMKEEEFYDGFITKEEQKQYETYWENRLGKDHPIITECQNNTKDWKKADIERCKQESDSHMKELVALKKKNFSATSPEVQAVIRKHYKWIKNFWTPNKESYIALGQGYLGFEWKKFFVKYDSEHPKLAMFLADGMKEFADRELS